MKIKKLIISLILFGALGAGINAGLKTNNRVNVVTAASGDSWYLMGTMNDWKANDDYKIIENGDPLIIDLASGDQFKVATSSWSTELTVASGDAVSQGNITFTSGSNSYVNTTGTYAFSVKDGALYADFGKFYYSGKSNNWDVETGTTGNHPEINVNGGASTWTLTLNDQFKLRYNNWDYGVFGYSNLKDGDFYGSFQGTDTNVEVLIAGSYDVSVAMTNHEWTVRIYPNGTNPDDTAYVYVLDKYGDKLNANHRAYTYDGNGREMTWPGAVMETYENTTHMYKQEFWTGMNTIIFNNTSAQTYDWDISLSGQYSNRNKCLILDDSWDSTYEKWSASTWVEKETGVFIENCMHFANYKESEGGNGECISQGWYETAKSAYNELSPSIKQEVSSLSYVVERLNAWAVANGETFTIADNVGSFSKRANVTIVNSFDNTAVVVIVISLISLSAVGGYFYLRKRKED